ncbi:hypothetical protein D3C71_1248480 [compost metagenome]
MLQPFCQGLDDRCGDRIVNLMNDANKLANLHRRQLRNIEPIYPAAERSLTESRTMAACAGTLGNVRCNRFLSALGLRLYILLDVFVSELLNNAFYCNINGLPTELCRYFPRLAVQQLFQLFL